MSFLKKALLVNTSQFACLALGMVQMILLSRLLGPDGSGQYSVILAAMMITTQACCLGVPMAFLYHGQRDREQMKQYLINGVWLLLLLGVLGGIVLSVLVAYRGDYFGHVNPLILPVLLLYVPVVLQRALSRNNLMLDIEARRLSIMNVAADVGNVGLIVIFHFVGILSAETAVICFVGAAAIRALFGWWWMLPRVDFSIRPSLRVVGKLVLMGVRQSWADLMIILNGQISIMLIRKLCGDFDSVGYFSRGQRIATLGVIAGQAVLPLLFSKWASLPEKGLNVYVEKVMRFVTTISVGIMILLILFGKWAIIILLGEEFLPAVTPMLILVPGTLLYLISMVLMQLFGSRGIPEVTVVGLLASVLVNASLTWWLVPIHGIEGGAFAASVTNVLLLVLLVGCAKWKFSVSVRKSLFLNREDVDYIRTTLARRTGSDQTQNDKT